MTEIANELSFDDIFIGQKESFSKKITESMVDEFSNFSGDLNPLHMNDEYAVSSTYGKRIVHGMLLASFFSQLIGMKLPGKNALYFSQTLNFRSPCYIDDKIQVIGKVTEKSSSTRIISISTSILNESGTCLIDGVAKVIVR
ncbi:MAG: enoyl-CoA hydratase [Thaumarchaeota archaeon]|nr:MAG: enoyl-CoA hydratase [Nitrososphaerota archaeon]